MVRTKILNLTYLDEIHALLNNHYLEHPDGIYRVVYSRDYLYWYLKMAPDGWIIGLVSDKNKLIGFIAAIQLDIMDNDISKKIAYVSLLCVHRAVRSHGMASILINEIKKRLSNHTVYFCTHRDGTVLNYSLKMLGLTNYAIPINERRLCSVGFIEAPQEDAPAITETNNPLHLVKDSDLVIIKEKLNHHLKKYKIRMFFDDHSIRHFILPKKDVVYSFINKENTDFVTVYKCYYYCIEKKKIISIAILGYYFYESMTLTELISHLIPKLYNYDFDQLSFSSHMDNMIINIPKFRIDTKLFFNGTDCNTNELAMLPF